MESIYRYYKVLCFFLYKLDEVLMMADPNGTDYYYLHDHLKSVGAVVDGLEVRSWELEGRRYFGFWIVRRMTGEARPVFFGRY